MQNHPLTFGSVVKSVAAGDFDVLLSTYRPFESHPIHAHDAAAFVYVVNGFVSVRSRRAEQHCPESSMRLIPAGVTHQTRYSEKPASCLVMAIANARSLSSRSLSSVLETPRYHPPSAPATLFAKRIHRELSRPDDATPLAVEALMIELLASGIRGFAKDETRMPLWLTRVEERIRAAFREQLSVGTLSFDAGVHPVHLARTFRKHFGCSIAEYQRRLRLEWARARLASEGQSVGRIALDAGFADHSEFTRRFVEATGVTPSQFRATTVV